LMDVQVKRTKLPIKILDELEKKTKQELEVLLKQGKTVIRHVLMRAAPSADEHTVMGKLRKSTDEQLTRDEARRKKHGGKEPLPGAPTASYLEPLREQIRLLGSEKVRLLLQGEKTPEETAAREAVNQRESVKKHVWIELFNRQRYLGASNDAASKSADEDPLYKREAAAVDFLARKAAEAEEKARKEKTALIAALKLVVAYAAEDNSYVSFHLDEVIKETQTEGQV
jgi:hypothetical protein